MTLSLLLVCTLGAADLNALKGIEVLKTPAGAQVVVTGSKAPIFTVFRLGEPDRLVVDVSSADAAQIVGHKDGSGPVAGVMASQFTNDKSSVGRVLIALEGATKYDVKAEGNRLLVSVEGKGVEVVAAPAAKAEEKAVIAPPSAVPLTPALSPTRGEGAS